MTLNGKPMRDDAYNLAEKVRNCSGRRCVEDSELAAGWKSDWCCFFSDFQVCDAYTGSKPAMCSTASVRATRSQALVLVKEHGFPVCAKKSGVV